MTLRGHRPYYAHADSLQELQCEVFPSPPDARHWEVLAGPYAVMQAGGEEQKLMNLLWDLQGRPIARGGADRRRPWHVVAANGVPGCVDVWVPRTSADTGESLN